MTWTDLPYATQQIDLSQLLVDRPQSLIKGPGQLRSSEGPKRLVDKTPMTERVNVVFSEMEHTLNHLPGRALSFISIDMDDSDCPSKTHLLADTAKFFRQYLKATSDNTAHRPCTADIPLDVARPIQTLLKTYSTWGSLGKCDAPITLHRTSHIRLSIASI